MSECATTNSCKSEVVRRIFHNMDINGDGTICEDQFVAYFGHGPLADGAVKQGLPRKLALELATQTLMNSAKQVLKGGNPKELRDNLSKNY